MTDNDTSTNIQCKMKQCKACNKNLPTTDFHKNGTTTHPLCKICRSMERKKVRNPRIEGIKKCARCHITKPSTEFGSDKESLDGISCTCKKCRIDIAHKSLSTFNGHMKNIYRDIRNSAKKRNIQVNITLNDILDVYESQSHLCKYLNIPMQHSHEVRTKEHKQFIINKWNISVDRIDSKKCYSKDNIQLVCSIINRMKMGFNESFFLLLCAGIAQYNYNQIVELETGNILNNAPTSFILDLLYDKRPPVKRTVHANYNNFNSLDGFINKLYLSCKHNAMNRAKDVKFNITVKDIMNKYNQQNGLCAVTGIKMTHLAFQTDDEQENDMSPFNISIDRKNCDGDYTLDNIELVCASVNIIKTDIDTDELLLLCDKISFVKSEEINKLIPEYIKSH